MPSPYGCPQLDTNSSNGVGHHFTNTGASPDYRDINGLTPLYYSILHKAELKVTQLLLNYSTNRDPSSSVVLNAGSHLGGATSRAGRVVCGATESDGPDNGIGITDQQGWQEVHHACKLGLDAHLDKLLYYGCDINAKISGSGNTPLHVAAINDQLNCAKVLLLRGADKAITNNSHQTAHQVAVVSNNMDMAEFISEHDESKVVPFAERPAPVIASTMIGAGNSANSANFANRHSFALPKVYNNSISGHAYNQHARYSISSAQSLVNSQSTNNLGNQLFQQHSSQLQNHSQYASSTLTLHGAHPRLGV